jgi:hypothetical protein
MTLSTVRTRFMMTCSWLALACADGGDGTQLVGGASMPPDGSGQQGSGPEAASSAGGLETDGVQADAIQADAIRTARTDGVEPEVVEPEPEVVEPDVALPAISSSVDGATLQDFATAPNAGCPGDTVSGTPFACYHDALDPALQSPAVLAGVNDDPPRFLRLAAVPAAGYDHNTITFPLSAAGAREVLLADFDFRITPVEGRGRADGLGFAFLNTAVYPDGAVPPTPLAEEPSFAGSLGIGFDIYKSAVEGDIGNENILPTFSDSISIHFGGQVLAQLDVEKISDMGSGLWHHARILLRFAADGGGVSLWLTPPCGQPYLIVAEHAIPTVLPYEARAWFGARSGGEAASHDIANVRVQFMSGAPSWVSFVSRTYQADEAGAVATLTLQRGGDSSQTISVDYATRDLTASAALDYAATTGTVAFAAGQTEQTVTIPLVDDALDETRFAPAVARPETVPDVDEAFEVVLTEASAGVALAGPAVARVAIVDDEGAREHGHWGAPLCWHIIGMHTHVLPQTGDVLYWDRLGNVAEWSPTTGVSQLIDGPGHNLFCAGHAFLADGELLISGGHDDPLGASMGHDGVGIDNLGLFLPDHAAEEHPWHPLVPMNAPRWYPTVTTLSNGEALVISGSLDVDYTKNLLPQIYDLASDTLRDLTSAMDPVPHGVQLYPWMFALPNAGVVKVGPDADTWLLDTAGTGAWTRGPNRGDGLVLDYGSAVLHGRHALIFGGAGADPASAGPSNGVAELDLEGAPLGWESRAGMHIARRQHNATLLPDGRTLVTGGSSAPGFSNRAGAATPAEIFDGVEWQLLPAALAQRLYHSSAVLLPDGRVATSGGGQGAGASSFQSSAELFYPDYWFKPRPTLLGSPPEITYDVPFTLSSSAPIERVTALRMASVTHSFDQNQRFVELDFSPTPGGASAVVPGDGWVPPGHYMLFVLDADDVPSTGTIVHISNGPAL